MYIPRSTAETDLTVLHALLRSHPLGCWVTQSHDGLLANHIPFLLDPTRGDYGTLVAHVARANPVWHTFSQEVPSLVIFQGADTYITPSWYPSKAEHGQTVPTWNYAVVHAHGMPRAIEDAAWLHNQVQALTTAHEATQPQPWAVADAPPAFVERLLAAIVGIEIPIARLEGKWKVSQNRPAADQQGVVAGLQGVGSEEAAAMAALVEHYGQVTGGSDS